MNFLSPWFLAAAALIAGPIVAHLIRRATRDRVTFSATRFLEASPPRLQRQRRLEHPWLLLARCLIVALLALAFARPFFPSRVALPAASSLTQDVVIIVDESASMRRRELWDEARGRVDQVVRALRPADRCAVFLASSRVTPLVTAEEWTQTPAEARANRVHDALAGREPSWGAFYLDAAINTALDALAETPRGSSVRQRLVVVSDFASGTRIAGLAGRDWPSGIEVAFERTATRIENNAGLQFLGWDETSPTPQARVRVSRDAGAPALRLSAQLRDVSRNENLGPAQAVDLGPSQASVLLFAPPVGAAGSFEVVLSGDAETFDNHLWLVPPTRLEQAVGYVGNADQNDPQRAAFYVSRALSSSRGLKTSVVALDAQAGSSDLAKTNLFIVTEPPPEQALQALRQRIESGAFGVVTASRSDLVTTAAALSGESGWTAMPPPSGAALLGQIDFAHPLFSLFADPRFSDFSHLRFWHAQPIGLPANSAAVVAARFDDGSPAVLESAVGRGRVITWGGDWSPAASQWVLSTKFVPWLQSLLERASGGPPRPSYAEIGQAERLTNDAAAEWRQAPGIANRDVPNAPGVYQLKDYAGERWVALEVPAEESRTDALPLDAFEQLGVPLRTASTSLATASAPNPMNSGAIETEARQKLWRWLLLAVAGLLAIESAAAWLVARREPPRAAERPGG